MQLIESVMMAFSSILAHKFRSLLTMLGIMIGVASVITIVAIGQGGEALLKSKFASTGNNTIDILYKLKNEEDYMLQDLLLPAYEKNDIYELSKIPEIQKVIATNSATVTLRYLNHKNNSQLTGISDGFYEVYPQILIQGRLITQSDIQQGRKVVLITADVKEALFGSKDPIGQIIEVQGIPLQVVGVVREKSSNFLSFGSKKTYVPLSAWPALFGSDEIQSITIQAKSADSLKAAGERAVQFLNRKQEQKGAVQGEYYILNMEQIQESLSTITNVMTGIIGSIAGVSLLVGGIGVMNIMLVSVTERTREIGIRKALGATRQEILIQFLIEAMALTTLGGGAGILLGAGGAYLVSIFIKLPPVISLPIILGGVLFSMGIGIIFGLLPANKASKLSPIEALRYE
ncbi:ABC transporter permease [Paenibacillus mucilaginosus]|uniref:ABC transporter, permease protein n=1 Tax=Paenibacillus mucilaginosus (strain KNP414) TaxID=1036673 RepID=F8FLZ2_PAEMK|nr:ABC transporter permease [Paenibacillus mucilaginosus]AEI45618.1 ABC transporter, permease protein [Paenibacillus mucilaginosus KNP414]MCG7215364.1 ABC transporter permease [Paenibacillus mucilaginosus]WDM27024.1 ABC transporter permease [Paenibacillus mucilaginosus]